jgi:ABC-type phosphate/phosphonate transport system substrate-binding protein
MRNHRIEGLASRSALGLIGCLLLISVMAAPANGGGDAALKPVRIGISGAFLRDLPDAMYQASLRLFRSLLESQTGCCGEIVPAADPLEVGEQLAADKIQVGIFHGFEFAWARQQHDDLKPLVIAINKQEHLSAILVVRDDCSARNLNDLKGKTLALPRRTKGHCHLFLERQCLACGESVPAWFGQVTTPPTLEDALDSLVTGKVDAAIVDGVFLDWYQDRKPKHFSKLKVLKQSETFPATVIAYHAGALDEATLQRFRDGLLNAAKTPRGQQLLPLCQMTSFEKIPTDYDRLLTEILKAYPPPTAEHKP